MQKELNVQKHATVLNNVLLSQKNHIWTKTIDFTLSSRTLNIHKIFLTASFQKITEGILDYEVKDEQKLTNIKIFLLNLRLTILRWIIERKNSFYISGVNLKVEFALNNVCLSSRLTMSKWIVKLLSTKGKTDETDYIAKLYIFVMSPLPVRTSYIGTVDLQMKQRHTVVLFLLNKFCNQFLTNTKI